MRVCAYAHAYPPIYYFFIYIHIWNRTSKKELRIIPFCRNYTAHAAPRIFHIACIPRNQMHMHMENRLPRGLSAVYSNIISVRGKLLINQRFCLPDKGDDRMFLGFC